MATNNESMYGETRRLKFFVKALQTMAGRGSLRVLEIGCGTGEGLLIPLAEAFRGRAEIVGLDSDRESIQSGNRALSSRPGLPLRFVLGDGAGLPADLLEKPWDVVILSEVIEHVKDPVPLLRAAHSALAPEGRLLVTVPNGYGPYEIERFFWDGLHLETPFQVLRRWAGRGQNAAPTTMADTNRHVGFYSWFDLTDLLRGTGFRIEQSVNREWFCGPFSDLIHTVLRRIGLGGALVGFSQSMGDLLPAPMVADWMVSASKAEAATGYRFDRPTKGFRGWWWTVKRRHSGRPD